MSEASKSESLAGTQRSARETSLPSTRSFPWGRVGERGVRVTVRVMARVRETSLPSTSSRP